MLHFLKKPNKNVLLFPGKQGRSGSPERPGVEQGMHEQGAGPGMMQQHGMIMAGMGDTMTGYQKGPGEAHDRQEDPDDGWHDQALPVQDRVHEDGRCWTSAEDQDK